MIQKRNSKKEILSIPKIQEQIIFAFTEIERLKKTVLCTKRKKEIKSLKEFIIKNNKLIKLIKSQIINSIISTFDKAIRIIFLFNIIGNNSSEKPNN